jgi:hypothetical protein
MVGDDAGPLERAWLCRGFRVLVRDDWEWPDVFAAEGETPALVMPGKWARSAEGRERAAGYAISELYLQRYDWMSLVRGIGAWDDIAAALRDRDRESAAD